MKRKLLTNYKIQTDFKKWLQETLNKRQQLFDSRSEEWQISEAGEAFEMTLFAMEDLLKSVDTNINMLDGVKSVLGYED